MPVAAASLPLPTGSATAELQATGNASIDSIDAKISVCDTDAVVVASSALPSGAATDATLATLATAEAQDTANDYLAAVAVSTDLIASSLATMQFRPLNLSQEDTSNGYVPAEPSFFGGW